MKKQIVALLAGALMTLAAGNAFAAYADLNLIRVVYDKTTNLEVAADLVTIDKAAWSTDASAPKNLVVGGGAQAFSLAKLNASSFSELNVAYYARGVFADQDLWLSSNLATGGKIESGAKFNGTFGNIGSTFVAHVTANYGAIATSNANSYYGKLTAAGTQPGRFAGIYTVTGRGEANLADLATTGYVDQYLYFFNSPNTNGSAGVKVATLRTMADGSTIVNYEAPAVTTPIPAAAWLMGSGLLGMIGIRRKKKA